MRVLAVYNLKGGVGKTATAVNLAWLSARSGARTLLWDLDPQGAATFYLRVRAKVKGGVRKLVREKRPLSKAIRASDYPGLDVLPADFSYRRFDLELDAEKKPKKRIARLIRPLARRYDHVWLDCAPSISLVSDGVFRAADALLVPTIPTTLSLRTLDQLHAHLRDEGGGAPRVLPFFSMVDRRKSLHREIVDDREAGPWPFLRATVPYSSTVERMGGHREPVGVFAPGSDAAAAYEALWTEAMAALGSLWGWVPRLLPGGRRYF